MARKMKDSGIEWIGEIPEGWEVKYFVQLFSQVKNKNTNLQEQNLLSLSYGKIKPKSIDTVGGLLPESFEGYNIIEKNDIVLRLTDLQNDQHSLRVGISNERGIITAAYCSIRVRGEQLPKYLFYFLYSFDISKGFYGMGSGVRQGLNWDGLKYIKVILPSSPEQNAISAYLEKRTLEIDILLTKIYANIEEYKKLKQAVITQAVTKGVRGERELKDSGVEWIGRISREWKIVKVKSGVTKVGSGKTPSGGAETYTDSGVLFLRSQNIYDGSVILDNPTYISEEIDESMKSTRVLPDDVLLNITGGSIGRCSIYPSVLGRANVNQHVCIIRANPAVFAARYLQYFWMSSLGHLAISLYQTGGNREGMSADAIRNTPIPYPSLNEQIEIADYLDAKCAEIDGLIAKKEQLVKELESYKKSLIYEVVTGKREV